MTISSTAPVISATGISAPVYSDVLAFLQAQFLAIYGSDAYLGNDSQDGQFLGILAQAIVDANAAVIAAYNAFSPSTAQGAGLSSVVKINGIARNVPTQSSVTLTIGGTVGTVIANGIAQDVNGNQWALPASITIPTGGSITATALCTTFGNITAAAGTITQIATPVLGWQTVTNAAAATAGAPVELDPALRQRQTVSVAIPSLTVLAGLVGALYSISGVLSVAAYENDTNTTDGNGLPAHSIALVVNGGDQGLIAQTIAAKKTPGCYTQGTTSVSVTDSIGIPHTIRFYRPTIQNIQVAISLHSLAGYTTVVAGEIQAAIAAYINSLAIGQNVMITRLYVPAQLSGSADSLTFEIVTLTASLVGGTLGTADIAVGFTGLAACVTSNITITVV
ncbi:MAG: baseplate J/gp47 family protein [Rhodospirillales bacterium]|nr:baseplate J/gp47 family protein [Rhodospirillales bacterium]